MPFMIQLKENNLPATPWRFTREFTTNDEYQTFCQLYINQKRYNSYFYVPKKNEMRFCQDLLFPHIEEALKVQAFVERVFAILGAILLDFLTFPIRLLFYVTRGTIAREQHPLHQYLTEQQADLRLLDSDQVCIDTVAIIPQAEGRFALCRESSMIHFPMGDVCLDVSTQIPRANQAQVDRVLL